MKNTMTKEEPMVTDKERREAARELTAEQVRKAIFNGSSYASYDGAKYYADGIGMQAIADELNATLGGNGKSRYSELFGTPERVARTLAKACGECDGNLPCHECPLAPIIDFNVYELDLLEWLRGDA